MTTSSTEDLGTTPCMETKGTTPSMAAQTRTSATWDRPRQAEPPSTARQGPEPIGRPPRPRGGADARLVTQYIRPSDSTRPPVRVHDRKSELTGALSAVGGSDARL